LNDSPQGRDSAISLADSQMHTWAAATVKRNRLLVGSSERVAEEPSLATREVVHLGCRALRVRGTSMNALGTFESLGEAFLSAIRRAISTGEANSGRGRANAEVRGLMFELTDPRARLIDSQSRQTNVPFLIGELLWQLNARDDVSSLAYYAPGIGRFSADGKRFTGSAYGARIFGGSPWRVDSQWERVLDCLRADSDTRRAIITIADPDESCSSENADMTCTTTLHFFLRQGHLHLIASMRSNDLMRGLQSDVFLFTMLQEFAAIELGVAMGTYLHVANLAQVYSSDMEWARACAGQDLRSRGRMAPIGDTAIRERLAAVSAAEVRIRTGTDAANEPGPVSLAGWVRVLEGYQRLRAAGQNPKDVDWVGMLTRRG
jgi:thymidylate synthase